VREGHAFPTYKMSEALSALRDYPAVREAVMLQTCNRIEIYAELEDYEAGVDQLKSFLRNFRHGAVSVDMSSYMYTLLGSQAVDHLLRVATGLDSMLIGEAEILGQVKEAYIQAQRAHSLGKTLHALFREAINAGKAARSHTGISGESTSVATAGIELAKQRIGTLIGKTVLVVGAGKMGSLAARRLRLEGCTELMLANRSHVKARQVVAGLGIGEAVEMPDLVEAIRRADIVVTSTGAANFVVTKEHVEVAMAERAERPLFIVDIAVPRDVEPDVAHVDNVDVADIDALKGLVEITLEHRRAAIRGTQRALRAMASVAGCHPGRRLARAKGRIDPLGRGRPSLGPLPRTERTRADADHRRLADHHLEVAAQRRDPSARARYRQSR
jgi:glutamyl-tRNA reductase